MGKRALVLGGGGSRGPYQIGVWEALRELGVDFQIVTGTSVGALNGAVMVQGDYERAREMWENLTARDVLLHDEPDQEVSERRQMLLFLRQVVAKGGLDVTPLEKTLRRIIDEEKVRASPVEYGLVTVKYPLLQPVELKKSEIPQGMLVDYLLASAAMFPMLQKREIDGAHYIDGAWSDNLPAELAVRFGAEEIVAVDIAGIGAIHPVREKIPLTYIHSHWDLGQLLVFNGDTARYNMRLGYHDALKAMRRLEGVAYTFRQGESARNAAQLMPVFDQIRRETGVDLWRGYETLPPMLDDRRRRRFLMQAESGFTLGRAVTTAAELAGELLGIPPDDIYRFARFNALLLDRAVLLGLFGGREQENPFEEPKGRLSRMVLGKVCKLLRAAYEIGKAPQPLWGLISLSRREFAAANYLLALMVKEGAIQKERGEEQ